MNYYFIQSVKSKMICKKYKTLEDAIKYTKSSSKGKYSLEIIATEIHDCHHNEVRLYNDEELYKVVDEVGNYVELHGGRWIKNCGDGRYYLTGDDNVQFSEVSINCYDGNGDYLHGEPIGFVQV